MLKIGLAMLAVFLSTVLLPLVISLTMSSLSSAVVEMEENDFPFRNISLPWEERVEDLVARLTLEEIQLQMARGGAGDKGGPAPAIQRLGIAPYQWDSECLTGDVQAPGVATGFPAPIGMAASFSKELVQEVAAATGREVRGKHNYFVKAGVYKTHTGASCFSPVVNILRDPRWGRVQETYGEDPLMSGELGASFVTGLQGTNERYVQASGTCKHFDVHGGPENIPESRLSFNANVTDEDWRMTFLPAFKRCIDSGVYSVMCSYNRINGVPACANKKLLTTILRKELGFKGYVVSDEAAIENIITYHKYLKTKVETVAACVDAGCNLELSGNLEDAVFMHIVEAVQKGKLNESAVRDMVKPLFYTRMRLGEFDPPDLNPYANLGEEQVESPQHQTLAVKAAMKSYVLLKNLKQTLPLNDRQYKNVSVIGPMSDNWRQYFSSYAAFQPRLYTKTPLDALKEVFPKLRYGVACKDKTPCKNYTAEPVLKTVHGADLVFVALGTGKAVESEGNDRPDVNLPGYQKQLLLDVIEHTDPTTKIILLLFSAGPLNITFADDSERVSAILECFLPGQGTGEAVVNILFNRDHNSSPAGRLPMTWPKFAWQIPPMVNYSMSGRTYRYMDSEPLYPFGYGLSYTLFRYGLFVVPSVSNATQDLRVEFVVNNGMDQDADEVVQCYIEPKERLPYPAPLRSLGAFTRLHLKGGDSAVPVLFLSKQAWAVWKNGRWTYTKGVMIVSCGGGQPHARGSVFLTAEVLFTD
ncbi:hypothetical protein RRG08_031551 [Elysia crispata]|uniref:Fibronectin type III-like domain-containing protein n=1 Tax=Elysia crispata TaxID=231223 RepID=A0AAE1AH95_9GAST|nr:hypothetical protein RRG08_031551 [Elysia crispata]